MAKRKLNVSDIETILDQISSEDDSDKDYSASESSYNPPAESSDSEEDENIEGEPANSEEFEQLEELTDAFQKGSVVEWTQYTENVTFNPKFSLPQEKQTSILVKFQRSSQEFVYFKKIFPRSLFIHIADCTNKRLRMLNREKNKNRAYTDESEILLFLGVSLIMHFNHVPTIAHYLSKHTSLGNTLIKSRISRDRYMIIASKIYFNHPQQPNNASKSYYISDIVSCFKKTFPAARSESTFQSIDESMAKFKGRSTLKQYLPLKPIKRGIKIWMHCHAKTGYTYDFDIYTGKQEKSHNADTLGERVVKNLCSTIRDADTVIAFDRFFTSVKLMRTLEFPAVGTYNKIRKNTPVFAKKLQKYESEFQITNDGLVASRWMDSKEVHVVSNCHLPVNTTTERKQKDGAKIRVNSPESVVTYNSIMGGVDLADQKSSVYDINRKSQKWWKKVFYKLLMVSVVNAWILHQESQRRKTSLLEFLVPLAEQMIDEGLKNKKVRYRGCGGRPAKTKKQVLNVGEHLPVAVDSRKRCVRCSSLGKEKRTKYVCSGCNNALCFSCFASFHK